MAEPIDSERAKHRARARRWLLTGYFLFVVLFVLTVTVEITAQALATTPDDGRSLECARGLGSLMAAVERARGAACSSELAEERAVAAFRAALEPEWSRDEAIRRACAASRPHLDTLDAIRQLRYAEENAARRESSDLAGYRRRARDRFDRTVGGSPPAPSGPTTE
jgi:hypothetical protein